MPLLFGQDVWEAYTPLLSPLEELKSLPDLSESEPDSNPEDGTPLTASLPTLPSPYLPDDVPPVDLGATETSLRLADNALGLYFPPFHMHDDEVSAIPTSTPQAESLRAAPSNHKDIRDRERPSQKRDAPQGYAASQSHVTANEALVAGCPQDICLQGVVNKASSSEMSTSRQKAHSYRSTSKPQKNHGPDDWLVSKERAGPCAVYAEESTEESNNKLLHAPLMRPVALPSTEETSDMDSEELLCNGPDIG